jgi:NAD(P)-dependent dehydrogenase (short-subunit alcohol dehydrogenase family)
MTTVRTAGASTDAGRLAGRLAVVTGGASGIGRACAELLLAQGATVAIADLDPGHTSAVARDIGCHGYAIDVAAPSAIESLAQQIERERGPVAMLVNSAGIIQGDAIAPQEIPMDTYDRVFQVNLRGTYAACVAFGQRMATRQRGAILNIASIAGMRSTPLHAYGPMKAAVIQLTENLAAEWGPSGVRVNCLSPGPVLTPALQRTIDKGQRDRSRMENNMATGKLVMPHEIAQAAVFLLSDEASAITGVNLPVDHGWLVASSWAPFGGLRPRPPAGLADHPT